MKKTVVIIAVVLAMIIGLVVAGKSALNSFRTFLMGEPDIIQEVVSPDEKYVAYVFEANAGSTTGRTYRLSVLKNGKKLKAGDIGNAFITSYEFDVEWIDNNKQDATVAVIYHPGDSYLVTKDTVFTAL